MIMKIENKWYFTTKQAREIKQLLDKRKSTQDKDEIKKIAQRLRNRGFYLSELGLNFSSDEFEKEVQLGNFIIDDNAIFVQSSQPPLIPLQDDNTIDRQKGCTAIIVIIILISIFVSVFNNEDTSQSPKVRKTERYNSSYDDQIDALKRDIEKSEVKSIVIYDDNCDSVATIYK